MLESDMQTRWAGTMQMRWAGPADGPPGAAAGGSARGLYADEVGGARPRGRGAAQPAAAGNCKAPGPFFDWSGPAGRSCLARGSRREPQPGGHRVRGRPAGRCPSRPSMGNHSGRPEDPEPGLCCWRGSRRAPLPGPAPFPHPPFGPAAAALPAGAPGASGKVKFPGCDSCLWNALVGL